MEDTVWCQLWLVVLFFFFLYSELFFVDCVVENSFALLACIFLFCFSIARLLWSAAYAAVAVHVVVAAG